MTKRTKAKNDLTLTRVTRTLYFFAAVFGLYIIVVDAGNLLTREAVIDRWVLLSALIAVNTFGWWLAAQRSKENKLVISLLVALTVVFAGFMTYWERGMASTSTVLYALPLLIAATLKSRHFLLATATLSTSTYAFAAVKYFNDFFNEGFRVQLWASILLVAGTLYTAAWLIMIATGLRHDSK